MKEIQRILDKMEPEDALAALVSSIKDIISHLDEEAKVRIVAELIGGANTDKIASMVNL